jgi:hypothetical protein
MSDDDSAALALFPPGVYVTAEAARIDARRHWEAQTVLLKVRRD